MTSSNGNIFRVNGSLCGEVTGLDEFPTQRPVTQSFDVFFDLRLIKRLSKQPWGWWFETLSWSLWRHCNDLVRFIYELLLCYLSLGFCPLLTLHQAHLIPHYGKYQEWNKYGVAHDDVIKWKHFPRNWPFVWGIHRSRWIPHTKASDAELWCFLWSASK